MSNWTDPNIKNHVSSDNNLRYSLFLDKFMFYNEPLKIFAPYVEKNMKVAPNLVYSSIDNEKLNKHMAHLSNNSPLYRFAYTSNQKPLQDSFFAIGHVYLYQIILNINKLWSITDYTDNNIPRVLVPTKTQITELWSTMLKETHFRNAKELTNEEDIREALEKLIINCDIDYSIVKIVSDKLHIHPTDAIKRLKSPLIVKYLSRSLSQMIKNKNTVDNVKLLEKSIFNMLHKLKIYIRENNQENQ